MGNRATLTEQAGPAPTPARIEQLTAELAEARKQIRLLTDKLAAMVKERDGLKDRLTRSPISRT